MPQHRFLSCVAFAAAALLFQSPSAAQPLSGEKTIVLSNAQGERQVVGTVVFTDAGGGRSAFRLEMSPSLREYFLAMRPFRCLTGPQQRLCWYPISYEAPLVSRNDLAPLEYALMFMKSRSTDLHLNPFNGVYYKLAWTDRGLTGRLHDVDMDPFITPTSVPPERKTRPLRSGDISEGDHRSHWLPVMTIE